MDVWYTIIVFVIDWTIRLILVFYIPRGRKPTAATAWLLTILILPGILGLLLYFLIGSTRPSKLRRHRQFEINKKILEAQHITDERITYPAEVAPFIKLNRNLSKFPAVYGNSSTILPEYLRIIKRITKDVKAAKHYVYIESFALALDTVTEPLFVAMEEAAARGVAVFVLFDTVGSNKYDRRLEMEGRLRYSKIRWRGMLPISFIPKLYSRPDLRNHRKLIAIDNSIAYIGSLNLIHPRYERKDKIIYEELAMRMQGPIVLHIAATIAGDWYSETAETLTDFTDLPAPVANGTQLMQILPSGPAYKNENNLKLFVDLIYSAKKKIVITNPYLVPTEPLLIALVTAAQRGVDVTIINSEAIDQLMVGHAQRSYYMQLLDSGIHLYLHKAPILLHSKHMTIDDDIAIIGSSNMDVRSFELDYECSAIVYDKRVVTRLRKIQKLNLSHSQVLTRAIWRKRSVKDVFLDSLFRLTSALQ
jgi:cardiolipin synthase